METSQTLEEKKRAADKTADESGGGVVGDVTIIVGLGMGVMVGEEDLWAFYQRRLPGKALAICDW